MHQEALLTKLVYEPDPLRCILDLLVSRLDPLVDVDDISASYDRIEEEIRDFEQWLNNIWGQSFYRLLVGGKEDWALPKAFKAADERDGNILICDGLSLRELLVLKRAFQGRVNYMAGKAPVPTTTDTVVRKVFNSVGLKDAITGSKLYWGRQWTGQIIEDISDPPRLGGQRGLMFLTHYPDAPLHQARSHRTTQIQDISKVIKEVVTLVEELSRNVPLIVTGDHGYIYLGTNPNKYMWLPYRRQERFGGEYGENGIEVEDIKVATGRYHAPIISGSTTFIVHGGISLTESLVPIIVIEAGATA